MNLHVSVIALYGKLKGKGIGAVLAKGASGSFAVMVLGSAMAFGTQILLARFLGVAQYGIYIYALTWINVLSLLCQLGMNTSLLRFVAAYNAKREWGLLRGILVRGVHYVLFASMLIGITASVIVWYLYEYIGSERSITFWIAFLLLPILSLTGLRSAGLRALKHVVRAVLPDSFFRPLVIVVLASIYYLYFHQNLQAMHVMVFNLVGALAAFYIGAIWLIKALPKQVHYSPPIYKEKEWLRVSLPLLFMSGMHLILHQADIIMIGALLDTEQAGIYAVASRIAALVIFGLNAVNAIVAPMISEFYSTKQYQELQKMITLAARIIFSFALAMSLILIIFGEFILDIFGHEFIEGHMSLLILVVGQVINATVGSVGFLMTMTGHQNQAAMILGVSALINILMNTILISIFGMIGAAIATTITIVIWNFMMLVYVWRQLNINPTVFAKN